MNLHPFRQLLQRYLRGDCTAREERLVEHWFEKIAQHPSSAFSPQESDRLEEKMLQRILEEVPELPGEMSLRSSHQEWAFVGKRLLPGRYAWVAALLTMALTMAWYGWQTSLTEQPDQSMGALRKGTEVVFQTNTSTKSRPISLEDRSKVLLMPGSSISYPRHFAADKREVHLRGNAFFEVAKNPQRPFFVYSGTVVTQVVGTSFWVKSPTHSKAVEVEVKTGRVVVYENTAHHSSSEMKGLPANRVVLNPNQKVTYFAEKHHLLAGLVNQPVLVNPTEPGRQFIFNDTPLPEVLRKLEKGYAIEMITASEKLSECTVTGDLAGMSLYEQLNLICEAIKATYEVKGTRILVSGDGCE